MPVNDQELLIDHLDQILQGQSLPEAEALIRRNANAREEWQYLQLAVDAIQHNALQAKVAAIRAEMQGGTGSGIIAEMRRRADTATPANRPVVRSITRSIIRIAAAVVLVAGSLIVYKLATVSAAGFYDEHFTSYQLPTARGGAAIDLLEQAFRDADWTAVNAAYNNKTDKTNKDHFLAGMAAMELKQFPPAIERFTQVLNNNVAAGDTYFQDETEYYLALAHIANGETEKALPLLKKIKADNNHPYREKARAMSGTDLKILELK